MIGNVPTVIMVKIVVSLNVIYNNCSAYNIWRPRTINNDSRGEFGTLSNIKEKFFLESS